MRKLLTTYISSQPEPTFTGLCFTAQEANSTVALNKTGSPTVVELETSTDGSSWSDYTIGDTITLANVGDKVYMRNKSEIDTGFSTSNTYKYQFFMTGEISSSGDVTSLLNKNGTNTLSPYCFCMLFRGCTSLTTAPELPATTLADYCYREMFNGCTNLTESPELPATELANYCYYDMFKGCTGLTTAPELPATTLVSFCYYGMFRGCTSLINPPELPATTLVNACYSYMFEGCTNIKLSETQMGEYQMPYIIPTTGTGTAEDGGLTGMFRNTGGTFAGTPSINTTYYLSNGQQPQDWTLFDETIISQSTSGSSGAIASLNGTIIRPSFSFAGGNGSYTIGTQDGFDVIFANGSHGNCHIGMSQSTYDSIMQNYSKIKLVCDYFNIGSQPSNYTNWVVFGTNDGIDAVSGGLNTKAGWNGITIGFSTPYSMVQIIDTATLNTTTTIKNLNTNATQTVTYTKVFEKETNSSYIINGGGPQWVNLGRDSYGGPAVCGNIHIYVQ